MQQKLYELTNPQKSIWLTEEFSNSNVNNISGNIYIYEPIQIDLLKQALNLYVEKNEAIRTRIVMDQDIPKQYIHEYVPFPVEVVSLSSREDLEIFNQNIVKKHFDFIDSDLFSFTIFQYKDLTGGLNVTFHHIISDAWTMSLFIDEVMDTYSKLVQKENVSHGLNPSYLDYLEAEKEYLASTRFQKDQEYWNSFFTDTPELAKVANEPAISDSTAVREICHLEPEMQKKIIEFCTAQHCSVYTFFMAIFSIYLSKITNIQAPIIGTPVLNRSNFKEKNTAGMYISTIPFKADVNPDLTFEQFLKSIMQTQMSIFRHQKYPYSTLLEDLKKKYQYSENLYQVALSYQNARDDRENCEISYSVEWLFTGHIVEPLDIHFYDIDNTGNVDIYYDYQVNCLTKDDVIKIHNRILAIISQVISNPDLLLQNIEMVTSEEKELILTKFNDTVIDYDKSKSLVAVFEEQVVKHPHDIALVFEDHSYTYEELNEKANRLAHYLVSLNVKENDKIAILLPRSFELILAMLAIKKANCAYLLIEKGLPTDRIGYMLQNAGVSLVITNEELKAEKFYELQGTANCSAGKVALPCGRLLVAPTQGQLTGEPTTQSQSIVVPLLIEKISYSDFPSNNLQLDYSPKGHLSVVYTSGSTGNPKGILVKNSSILNLVLGYCHSMQAHTLSNFLSICSVSFDMFAAEVWVPLLLGRKLVLTNEEESQNPILMSSIIEKNKIEFMLITSSRMNLLLLNENTRKCLSCLKAVQLGGEVLEPQFYEKLVQYTNSKIYNGYGPSETTSCATCKLITSGTNITIGTPLPNIQVYICNELGNLCPPNVIGELCIAGDGVSYGYINQPQLTQKSFIPNKFGKGLLYKTGDLAKFLPNGEIEFIGRTDSQVKIRGLRVELEEINKVVNSCAGIEKSVTVIKKINGIDSICCYYTGKVTVSSNEKNTKQVSTTKVLESFNQILKNEVSKKLPYYMVPSHFMYLEQFPLTVNGKIDTKNLPEFTIEVEYVAPETDTEKALCALWQELFQLDRISITSNFFELGGDSLGAIRLVTQIEQEFKLKLKVNDIFTYSTIRDLAEFIDLLHQKNKMQDKSTANNILSRMQIDHINKATKQKYYPVSSAQKRIYTASSMDNNSVLYNIAGGIIVDHNLDTELLQKCFQALIQKHEVLRTHFDVVENEIVQIVEDNIDFALSFQNVADTDLNAIYADFIKPFDLSKAPLFRAKAVTLPNNKMFLLLDMHHIISDGTSFSILLQELCNLYNNNLLQNTSSSYRANTLQSANNLAEANSSQTNNNSDCYLDYKDFTLWEKKQFETKEFKQSKDFWVNQYQDEIPLLNMPTTYTRPSVQSFEGANYYTKLPKEIFEKVNNVAKSLGITPYMLLLSVYYILLSKYTSGEDIVIGTPIVGRELPELTNMLGMFVNTLALRNRVDHSSSFSDFAGKIKKYCLSAFENQAYPFDELVKELKIKKDTSRSPLFDMLFVYQNDGFPSIHLGDGNVEYFVPDNPISKFDLTLEIIPIENEFSVRFEYCTKLFDEAFIKRLASHYTNILDAILENSNIKIADIDMLSEEERHQILHDFNNTYVDYPRDKTIVDLFEEQVGKTPNNIALVFEDKKLTYQELNGKANSLARYLVQNGAKPNDIIGIMLPRSLEMLISILAVLKAGSAYLPIDPDYPADRISYMLEDSRSKFLITFSHISDSLASSDTESNIASVSNHPTTILNLDTLDLSNIITTNISTNISSDDLSYIIYTSGSTGKPKGVKLKHLSLTNLANYCNNYVEYLKNNTYRAVVSVTTVSFDIFIFETLISLQKGLKLVLANEKEQNIPVCLDELIAKENIEIIQTTPSRMQVFYSNIDNMPHFNNLKFITLAGEQLPISLMKNLKKACNCMVYNGYGPSETTVFSTLTDVTNMDEIIIGKPLYNTQIYIVNSDNQLSPVGVPGEICISGEGVGYGYINKEDLTKKAFVPNPFVDSNRTNTKYSSIMYKTGDLGYYDENGEIFCLGRIDNQVKIRGLRIELGEIEKAILQNSNIVSCTVIKRTEDNGHEFLCAYFVKDGDVDVSSIKEALYKKLPNYMVPQYFMELSKLPYTPNGKIDKNKLPVPKMETHKKANTPRNNLDTILITLYKSLLKIEDVDIEDSLYDLGGDSLTSINLATAIYNEFGIPVGIKDIFSHPTVKELSDFLASFMDFSPDSSTIVKDAAAEPITETASSSIVSTTSGNHIAPSKRNAILKAKKRAYYPTSSAQKRIYYASSMDKDSTLYNIAGGIVIDKVLNTKLLQKCFQVLVDSHDILRTHFAIIEDEIVQIVEDKVDFTLSSETSNSDDLNSIYTDFVKPFDLSTYPLFRAKAVTLPNDKMFLLLDMHHSICDGTSLNILLQELCNLYNGESIPEHQVDYKDFALWEKEQFEKEEFNKSKDFWVNQFKDDIPLLNMPSTFARPSSQSFEGANYYTKLSKEVLEQINVVSKKLSITPYMLMLSVYYVLLSKYTSCEDIVVGTPIVGRELPELTNMLGMFVNTLALRNKVNSSDTFGHFAERTKEYCLSAFEHQQYPFDELVKALNIKRDTSRSPLIDVMFIYQNTGYPSIHLKNTTATHFVPDGNIAKFDLSLEIVPVDNELSLRFEYCTKLFDEDFIKNLSSHYIHILNVILENSDIKIADIDMLSPEEEHQILYDFNNTKVDYPRDKTIVDLFEEQAKNTPSNIAVVFEDKELTYQELNEKANQLGRFLVSNNVSSNDIVCLLLDKSLEAMIAILAILKVGAAYLPIDVNYPSDRIDYIIKDSKSKVLLTTKNNIHKSNGTIQALCIDLDSRIYSDYATNNIYCKDILPDSLAYIMYTSGSTGNPKGVMINHRNIVRLVKNNEFIKFDKQERILQTGSIVFDACTFEIFGTLLNGFELYIIKKETLLDALQLQDYLIKNKITILWLTAPLFNQLCEESPHMFHTVKTLLTGGDVLSPRHINMARAANPNLTIINGYGPTENTTFSCCFTVDKKYTNSIPIGKPISNSTAYVVSSTGNLCPIGVPGELWVGGDGVGKGYLNNDHLTKEKFIQNPFGDGILYKTGDLVKWLPNGTIDFIGRIDNQVKIRGFRVELGEITAKISNFSSIKDCVTVVNEIRGEKTICSYIVSDREVNIQELKQYLKRNLPIYMIPTYFMQLEKLPINTNGKVDRKLLPTNFKNNNEKHKVKLPTNDKEQILLDIFKKLLSFDDIGIDDDFFELGGDSLLAIKLQVEAVSNGLQINYADIFDYHTVEELAKYVDHAEDSYTEEDFDYEKYESILEKNKITPNMQIETTPIGNVLLTGFTGFLGAHVLDSFIQKENGIIYCLIRGKNNMSPMDRLKNVLHFYFDTKYDKYIGNRIRLVEGDITLSNFGLNNIDYNVLGTNVSTVIHCAALVKHYGSYKDFESINIIGTKRVIDFSKAFDLKLLHVSTISVSGNNLVEGANVDNHFEKDMLFTESNFYIGQNLKNFYVRSKFEAERLVLDAIADGLQACILRMGNLTSRFSEGKFQQNHFENAFVNTIKSFIQIGSIPDYLLNSYCEFTPIDFCGNAIIDIANHMNRDYTVFHLLNEKHVDLDRLFKMLNEIGIPVNLVTEEEFRDTVTELLKDENKKSDLDGIINNLDGNKKFMYKSDVSIDSTFTKEYLSKIGFEWPYIDIVYIRNYFKYLTDIGYFNLNIN